MDRSPFSTPGLADIAPGGELATMLEQIDIDTLDDSPVVDVIVAAERQIAHLRAVQMRTIVELSQRENYAFCGGCDDVDETDTRHRHDPVRAVGSELSAALVCTPAQADVRAALAVELAEDLPATLDALDAGRIDERRADLIAAKTRVLDPLGQQLVEDRVLPTAGQLTTRQLARLLDREVIAADPAAAERRRQRGRDDRRVERPRALDSADGLADMVFTGPAEDLAAFWTAIDTAARAARHGGDERTLDQLRFDIATGLGWNGLTVGHLGCCNPQCASTSHRTDSTQHGRPATVNVTIAYSTLIGADDEPAHLDGYGPITAETGRVIAADATLRRLLTDPADGQLLEFGRTTYTPPQALADFVIARDVTCRFPTSDTPARSCDIDHRVPYDRGGTTGATNNQALARRFHVDKTLHGWRLDRSAPGRYTWTSPAGRICHTRPEIIGPVHHPPPDETPDPPPF